MRAKIALVGEAWGEEEARAQTPFVGTAGRQLDRLLDAAGIRRSDCFITNCFNLRPQPSNDISNLCGTKREVKHNLPPLNKKYILDKYLPELDRLYQELDEVQPNLVIALGGTAAWALQIPGSISRIRGAVASGRRGVKVLPTYHPSAVMREWSLYPVVVADLLKAKREAEYPYIRRPQRQVWIEPSLTDMELYYETHLKYAKEISIDIETAINQITCIGFSPTVSSAIVVPFVDYRKDGRSYWQSPVEENLAWNWVRRVCALPAAKVFQNGLYDIHFIWRSYHIPIRNCVDDTMLLHHALQPEMEKGLGFLGSVYTDETSWKLMRVRSTTVKRDE